MKKLGILATAMMATPLLVSEAFATCGWMPPVERQLAWSQNTVAIAAGVSLGTLTGGDVEEEPTRLNSYVTYQAPIVDDIAIQVSGLGGYIDIEDIDIDTRGASIQVGHKNIEDGMHVIDAGMVRTRISDGFGNQAIDAEWIGYQGRCFSESWTIGHSIGAGEFEADGNELDVIYYEGSANYYLSPNDRVNAMFDVARYSDQNNELDTFRFAVGFETEHPWYDGNGFGQSPSSNVIVGVYAGYNRYDYNDSFQDNVEFFDVSAKIKFIHMPGGNGSRPTLQDYDFFGNLGYVKPRALSLPGL